METAEIMQTLVPAAHDAGPAGDGAVQDATTRRVPPIIEAACQFARVRGRPAAIYLLGDDEALGTPNVRHLAAAIDGRRFNSLDLVIQSSGGDIHAAYQLISFLRQRMDRDTNGKTDLVVCVPRYARSAATLVCLGGDSIVLDELAAVGPLDAQVYSGQTDDGRPRYQSALNQFKSLERLREFSLESLSSTAAMLHDSQVRRNEDVLRYGIDFVRVIASPLFERIESQNLGDYSQALAIGEEYGRRLLRRLEDGEKANEIVSRLVHRYPSHEYVIDCFELKDMGLNARVFDEAQRPSARELANYHAETLIMLVEASSSSSNGARGADRQLQDVGSLDTSDWIALAKRKQPSDLVWQTDAGSATIRLARLGREPAAPPPNPWRSSTMRRPDALMLHQVPPGPAQDDLPPWMRVTPERQDDQEADARS